MAPEIDVRLLSSCILHTRRLCTASAPRRSGRSPLGDPPRMDHVTRPELRRAGWTDREIRAAVDDGSLVRLRPGHFGPPGLEESAQRAVASGGRVACVSELRVRGVWVLDDGRLHLHVPATASRVRAGDSRVHWRRLVRAAAGRSHVSVLDALIQAQSCLDPFAWVASIDSAWHLGMITSGDVQAIRAAAIPRLRPLVSFLDRRSESGLESIVRMIAHELGLRVRSQVRFPGVGRVDLLVEGRIVVETDGTAFHDVSVSARRPAEGCAARGPWPGGPPAGLLLGRVRPRGGRTPVDRVGGVPSTSQRCRTDRRKSPMATRLSRSVLHL